MNQPHGKLSAPLRLRSSSRCDNSNHVGPHLVFLSLHPLDVAPGLRDTSRASPTRLCYQRQFAISLMYLTCRVQAFLLTVHQRCQYVVFRGYPFLALLAVNFGRPLVHGAGSSIHTWGPSMFQLPSETISWVFNVVRHTNDIPDTSGLLVIICQNSLLSVDMQRGKL